MIRTGDHEIRPQQHPLRGDRRGGHSAGADRDRDAWKACLDDAQTRYCRYSFFIAVPVIVFAQKESPIKTAPKAAIAQVRKLVQMISGNKAKLKIYCDVSQLEVQIEEAETRKDSHAL